MTVVTQATLSSTFAGELIGPHHTDYDTARLVFNGVFDTSPADVQIARCTSPADVQIALEYAREHEVVAVRGGGHSIPDTPPATTASSSTPGRLSASRSTPRPDRPIRRRPHMGRARRRREATAWR